MDTHCDIVEVEPMVLALAEAVLPRAQIPARIRGLFDAVYGWLRASGLRQAGHNIALYDQCTDQALRMRAGVPVSARFEDTAQVKCVELAPGRAAHARHVGPYERMEETYRLLHAWCASEKLAMDGESWEIYGDWHDDPAKLVTDIYVRLRDCPRA